MAHTDTTDGGQIEAWERSDGQALYTGSLLEIRGRGQLYPYAFIKKKSSRAAFVITEFTTDSKVENIFIRLVNMTDSEDEKEEWIETSQVHICFWGAAEDQRNCMCFFPSTCAGIPEDWQSGKWGFVKLARDQKCWLWRKVKKVLFSQVLPGWVRST